MASLRGCCLAPAIEVSSRTSPSPAIRLIRHDPGHAFLSPLLNRFPPGLLPCAASPWQLRFLRDLHKPCSPGLKFFTPCMTLPVHSHLAIIRILICIPCIALVHSPTLRLAFRAMECDGDTLDAIHTTLARSYLDLEVSALSFLVDSVQRWTAFAYHALT